MWDKGAAITVATSFLLQRLYLIDACHCTTELIILAISMGLVGSKLIENLHGAVTEVSACIVLASFGPIGVK